MSSIIKRHSQSGLSLVSLMISIGLSAFLTTVLLQVFTTSRTNYSLVENIVHMDDSMNFIVSTMRDIIPYAGYRSVPSVNDPLLDMILSFPGEDNIPNAQAGMYVMPFTSPNNKDGFTIAYQGHSDGYIKDCHGTSVGVYPEVAYLTFKQVAGEDKENDLICNRYNTNKSTEMISKVLDQFWVRYGEDSDDDGYIDKYLTASQNPNYLKVRALQLAVLLHSPQEVFHKAREYKFVKWGEELSRNDKYLYKFMTFTFPFSHIPDPTEAKGGTILTDSPASTSALPFEYYSPPDYYFKNTKAFSGNSITHDGSTDAADGTVVFISPFIEASSINKDKEIYVEYYIGSKGTGENIYFCYFFEGILRGGVGYDSSKMCFKHTSVSIPTPSSTWSRYNCSIPEEITVTGNSELGEADVIGMSISFPQEVSSGSNIVTKLYKNGTNIYTYSSNGGTCQASWNKAIVNKEKIVFTVGEFWRESGMMQFTLNKPPQFLPDGALPLQ